ncbi:hypothetical protein DVS28_b0362 (plasmid) [Euzebya pacifica]|uniref:Uncharacterized protein n=1 Tax=Euzebya pacifica TaxID=1608957 RepID=A0A346Y6N5_9ACTN|nr:hypothetical protein [Euzebya pacifica]AXV10132.1 hypothetical protein DVS28_b0362 [Euzebya pacifica]
MIPVEIGLDWHLRHAHDYFAEFLSGRRLNGQHNWVHLTRPGSPERAALTVFQLDDGHLSAEAWYRAVTRAFGIGGPIESVAFHTDMADGAGRRTAAIRVKADGIQALQLAHGPDGRVPLSGEWARRTLVAAMPAVAVAAESLRLHERVSR